MDDFLIQTSFKYYQNHKFHKLVEKTSKRLYLVFSAPAVKRKKLKSGCGFFVKEGLRYKIRKDLDNSYSDGDNEFHCCWNDIINQNSLNIVTGVYYRHSKNIK